MACAKLREEDGLFVYLDFVFLFLCLFFWGILLNEKEVRQQFVQLLYEHGK